VSEKYRVQAKWTVDGEPREYRPVFFDERHEAEQAAEDMRRTLAHFPTLAVSITVVDEATAGVESAGLGSEAMPEVHVVAESLAPVALCGKPTSEIGSWVRVDLFLDREIQPTVPENVCPTCHKRAGR
jgi:hypothetical protein